VVVLKCFEKETARGATPGGFNFGEFYFGAISIFCFSVSIFLRTFPTKSFRVSRQFSFSSIFASRKKITRPEKPQPGRVAAEGLDRAFNNTTNQIRPVFRPTFRKAVYKI
jgi:hypothetical protein